MLCYCGYYVQSNGLLKKYFQNAARVNDDTILDIMEHVETELENGKWSLVGWWKATSISEDTTLVTPRCHIVALRKEGAIRKWLPDIANSSLPSDDNSLRRES